jgi:HAD superfamily hydrolase (TIGR01549 family)
MILIVNQHNHLIPNSIKLDNQVTSVLKLLRKTQKSLFIVTNGTPKQQRNKVKCIDWCDLEKDIEFIFANEIYPKPNKLLFDYIEGKFCVNRKKAIYIGDSNTDREFANNSNINFKYMKDFINENINSFTSYR